MGLWSDKRGGELANHRVKKESYVNGNLNQTTYYVRDVAGQVMAIYTSRVGLTGVVTEIAERPMYGSDRIGQDTHEEEIYSTVYNFSGEADYNAIMVEFVEQVNSVALNNVLVAQQVDQDIFDTDGNLVTVPGTNLTTATVDGEFVELLYDSMLIQDADSTPVITDNNIFLIEDVDENPLGYGVVASNYFSTNTEDGVMLIYDTNGDLINGLQLINADTAAAIDYLAKSVVVKNPARNDEFILFYKDVTGNLHMATLSTAPGSLEVVATAQLGSSNYGRHMAVVDDRQMQRAFIYATAHTQAVVDVDGNVVTPPQATLVRFALDATGAITEEGAVLDPFESYDIQGNGELQVALDGNTLSMYNYTALATQWTGLGEAELRTWQLDDDWLPVQNSTNTVAIGGNIGKGSVLNTGSELYYTQRVQEVSTTTETVRIIRASDGQVLANTLGDLRANKNNKFYNFTQGADNGQEYNLTATNIVSLNNLPTSTNGTTGHQPYQPYTINGVTPPATNGVVYRNVGEKHYELKDHLGNVRVVVSDRKNLDTSDNTLSANVVSYNNYYPFGMPQPNRTFDSQEYRYGFQGQEKDSELKGEGLSVNYKYRMHDPRIGRFFAVDPLTKEFPHYSPYSFGGNKAVAYKELEGAEELISIVPVGKQSPEIRNIKGQLIEELSIIAAEVITEEGSTWVIKSSVNSAVNAIKAGKLVFSNGIEHTTSRLHLEPEVISFEGESVKLRRGVDWKYAGADGVQNSSRAINQLAAQINKNKAIGKLFDLSKSIKNATKGPIGLGEVIGFVWTASTTGELDPFALQPIPTFMLAFEKDAMTAEIEQSVLSEFDKAIQGGVETTSSKINEWNHNFLEDFELYNVSTRTLLLIDLGEITEFSDISEQANPYEETPHVLLLRRDSENDKVFIVTRFIDTNKLEQDIEQENNDD